MGGNLPGNNRVRGIVMDDNDKSGSHGKQEIAIDFKPECNNACVCCEDTIEEIAARTESRLRDRALTLSSAVTILFCVAHICFVWNGKDLPMPEVVWAIILAPWLGASAAKIADIVQKVRK